MKSRRGLSYVLTTTMILVASVVMGSGVVLYGGSLFESNVLIPKLSTEGTEVWVNATDPKGVSWGASGVRNSGDKIISVSLIQIRGVAVPFTNWYADKDQSRVTSDNFQTKFQNNGTDVNGILLDSVDAGGTVTSSCAGLDQNVIELDFDGDVGGIDDRPTLCLSIQSGPLSLNPGERSIIYFRIPEGTLSSLDSGQSTRVNISGSSVLLPESVTIANP